MPKDALLNGERLDLFPVNEPLPEKSRLLARQQKHGLVVQARCPQRGLHRDLLAHVHVFRTRLHAELSVPPNAELDA